MPGSAADVTVSIIMNCYNSDRFLNEAIDSIYAQTYPNWEIIFWDNASSDNSAAIARSYDERLKYFLAEKTTPLGEARNLALQKAKGKYIAFLDCDDLYLPDKLEKQVKLMDEGDFALCYGSAINIDKHGKEISRYSAQNDSGSNFALLLKHYDINMQSVMLRRQVLLQEGLSFNTSMQYCPDHNLFMGIASRHDIGVLPDFLVKYRILDDSLSKKTIAIASSEVRLTLDEIFTAQPDLKTRYSLEARSAYAKLHYYDAIASLYENNRRQARRDIKKIIWKRWEYFLIYLMFFAPLSDRQILRLLGR
jgi:glycosyltransferase involved in cell wall biosynthesis